MAVIYQQLFDQVDLVLKSKLVEFKERQYNDITTEDLWNYCVTKKWKKVKVEDLHVHEIVATIFSLKPSDLISHAHVNGLHQTDLSIGLDLEELNMLLKPLKSE